MLRIPVSILCFVCAIGLCLAALVMHNLVPFYLALFFLLIVFASSHRDFMAQAAFMMLNSSLMIPKLPGDFYLYQLLLIAWVALVIAQSIIDKRKVAMPASWPLVVIFILNMAIVIAVRGFGIRVLGGAKGGGMVYVQTISALLFYLYSRRLVLSTKIWKRCFVTMALLSFIPFIAQVIFIGSHGLVWHQFMFVRFSSGNFLQYQGSLMGAGTTRWTMFGSITPIFWIAVAIWEYKGMRNVLLYMLFFGLSLVAAVAASYRSGLLIISGTLVLIFIFYSRNKRAAIAFLLVAMVVSLIVVSIFYEQMPFSFQRTLSVLPWLNPSTDAAVDAAETIDWRKLLWLRTSKLIPQYLLIGRGYSYDLAAVELLRRYSYSMYNSLEYFLYVGSFHNGSLELLILLGATGLISVVLFVINEIRVGISIMNSKWRSGVLQRYYQAIFAYFAVLCIVNLVAGSSLPVISLAPIYLGLMWALWQSDQVIGQEKKKPAKMPNKRIVVGI